MEVIVDTSVWSEYFRRNKESQGLNVDILKDLIKEGRVILAGVVKQELLSGMREKSRFEKLSGLLSVFPTLLASDDDHVLAALFFNECRRNGIQGSFTDFLICAQSHNNKMSILSNDGDFEHYSKMLPIYLWHSKG